MRGALLRNFHLYTRNLHFSRNLKPPSVVYNGITDSCCKNYTACNVQLLNNFPSRTRFFSSENRNPDPDSKPESESSEAKPEGKNAAAAEMEDEDVDIEELKKQIDDYLHGSSDEGLPKVFDSILKKISGKDEDTWEELREMLASDDSESDDSDSVIDAESGESDIEETDDEEEEIEKLIARHGQALDKDEVAYLYEKLKEKKEKKEKKKEEKEKKTEEIGPLCDADDFVMKKMASSPYFNMDDKKYDDMINEAMKQGKLRNMREREFILEDMLNSDKPLPDIKETVEEKFNEIGDRIERGELSVDEGYELFKKFEDQIVMDCSKQMEAEGPTDSDKDAVNDLSDEGPTLRWQTRVVFLPGGESWHPKNRKVKLATTVKEYGLSKPQFVRLRELVGKRYNPAKDELTITSERFEHREENRKDCLRTLLALMEEARKAEDLVHEARVLDIKARLKANPKFMQRLQSKKQAAESKLVTA